jgi:Domain of unknown function (DUF4276)
LIRLHVVVEGQTEEGFINEVLAPELGSSGVFINAHSITTGRRHGRVFRGGWDSYGKLSRDLSRWMKQDQNNDSRFSTMVDLYRLPNDFPGYELCRAIPEPRKCVECLEEEFARDIREQFGDSLISQRFIPYIQLHEFEALLFSDPDKFLDSFPDAGAAIAQLHAIRARYGGPEDIDGGEATAPSKQILEVLPDFVKAVSGILIAKRIGLATFRRECPHFDGWIAKLLQRANQA